MDYRHILNAGQYSKSPFFEPQKKKQKKKQSKVSKELRRETWFRYIGPHVTKALCLGCETHMMTLNEVAGWEAAHVVAYHYYAKNNATLTKYDLIPLCRSCNLNMGTMCMWEWLYTRGRIAKLKELTYAVYSAYCEEHPRQAPLCWKLIMEKLHGTDRFPNGGTITDAHFKTIKTLLRMHQQEVLEQDTRKLLYQMETNRKLIESLYED